MNKSNNKCPICGEGLLHPQVDRNPVEYKGRCGAIDLHFSLCDVCGSEQSDAAQLRTNKRGMVAFKKQVDGLLTGAEVRALRERLGINQAEAARIFGGGPVAFSKYESDEVAQSEAMDKLLRLADELPAAFALLARRAGLDPIVAGGIWEDFMGKPSEIVTEPGERQPRLRVVSCSAPMDESQARYAA
jgi:HTH-type transcriptional regulator / antitoxin MqsA